MTKAFVVVGIDFQYNDEVYLAPEGNGGTPTKVFLSKEKADAECAKLTRFFLEGKDENGKDKKWSIRLCEYGYNPEEVLNIDFANDVLKEVGGYINEDEWEFDVAPFIKKMDNDQFNRFLGALHFEPYNVIEVDIEM